MTGQTRPAARRRGATSPSRAVRASEPVESGVTIDYLIKLARPFGLDEGGVCKMLVITPAVLSRWRLRGGLPERKAAREQIAATAWLLTRAYDLYPVRLLPKWLRTPRPEFARKAPYHLIQEDRAAELLASLDESVTALKAA